MSEVVEESAEGKRIFPPALTAEQAEKARLRADVMRRPSGKNMIGFGIALMVFGVAAALIAAMSPPISDPGMPSIGIAPTYNTWVIPTIWLGSAAASIGLVLWLVGTIVRAIFFLAGRNVSAGEVWGDQWSHQ